MDPVKAAKLLHDVAALESFVETVKTEFDQLWNIVEELHYRTLYIMEKVTLVHRELSPIEGVPPKDTRTSLTALFAQERETFIARVTDAQDKLALLKSGAHLTEADRDPRAAAGAAASQTGEGASRNQGQLVRL